MTSPSTAAATNRNARLLKIAMGAAVGLVGVVAAVVTLVPGEGKKGNAITQDPIPAALFPAAEVAATAAREHAEESRADHVFARWIATHRTRDDLAFTAFVEHEVPPPPSRSELERGLPLLHRLEATRTPARARVVAWLFLHGKQDVWKLFAKQYGELAGKPRGKSARAAIKRTIALANLINTDLKHSLREPHPLQLDHTLSPIIPHPGATKEQTILLDRTKYGYPSNHTNISYAAATVLAAFEPARSAEFFAIADQVSYSRLVAGIHFEGDLAAGAFEGRLIGDYEAHFAREGTAR